MIKLFTLIFLLFNVTSNKHNETTTTFSSNKILINENVFSVNVINNIFHFSIIFRKNGYIGLAFGKNMEGTDIITSIWKGEDQFSVFDQYAEYPDMPPLDEEVGGRDDLENKKIIFNKEKNEAEITFQRKLNTLDTKDKVIEPDTSYDIAFAFKDGDYDFHDSNIIFAKLIYFSSNNSVYIYNGEKPNTDFTFTNSIIYSNIFFQINIIKNKILFTVKMNKADSIDFSFKSSMIDTDYISIEWKGEESFSLKDQYKEGDLLPKDDTSFTDGKYDFFEETITYNKEMNSAIITFQRLLNTEDKYDFVIENNKANEIAIISSSNGKYTTNLIYFEDYQSIFFYKGDKPDLKKPSNNIYINNNKITTNVNNDHLEFNIEFWSIGFLGIGFGDSMFDTDMIIVLRDKDDKIEVQDTFATEHSKPKSDTELGGNYDIDNLKYNIVNGIANISFTRKLNTNDNKYDKVIEDKVPINMSFAYRTVFGFHGSNLVFSSFIYFKNSNRALFYNGDVPPDTEKGTNTLKVDGNLFEINSLDDKILFKLTFTKPSWMGLGFGTTMENVDMIATEYVDNSTFHVYDLWAKSMGPPDEDINVCEPTCGTDDIENKQIQANEGNAVITFERKFNTKDKYDKELLKDKNFHIVIAYNDGPFMDGHKDRIYKYLFYSSKDKKLLFYDEEQPEPEPDPHPDPDPSLKPTSKLIINNNIVEIKLIDDKIAFKYTMKKKGYIGLDFGTTMKDADMIIVLWNENDQYDIMDCYSQSRSPPPLDTKLGGTDDILNKNISNVNGEAIITFERKLNTNDKFDKQIISREQLNIVFVWKDGEFGKHDFKKHPSLLFYDENKKSIFFYEKEIPPDPTPTPDDNKFPTSKLKVNSNLLEISVSTDQILSFKYTTSKVGFLGLGFGSTMKNTDMISIVWNGNENYAVYDLYAKGEYKPATDEELGGSDDIMNRKISFDGTKAVITFDRKLITGDKFDFNIEHDKDISMAFVWLNDKYDYHGKNKLFVSLRYDKIRNTVLFYQGNEPEIEFSKYYHGLSQTFFWFALNTIGIFFSRYLKYLWYSKYIHIAFSGLTSGNTLLVSYLLFRNNGFPSSWTVFDFRSAHIVFGFIIIALILLQALLGIITYILLYVKQQKSPKMIKIIRLIHQVLGLAIILFAFLIVFLGFSLLFDKYKNLIIALTGVVLILVVILEVNNSKVLISNKVLLFKEQYNNFYLNEKIPEVEFNDYISKHSDKKLGIVYNFIVDLSFFISHHPGGRENIERNLNTDLTRFLIGNVNSLDAFCPHMHGSETIKYILSSLTVAKLSLKENPLIQFNSDEIRDSHNINNENQISPVVYTELPLIDNSINYLNHICEKVDMHELANDVYQFKFKTKEVNVKFPIGLPGIEHIGKHYVITSTVTNISRMYSISFMLNKQIRKKHLNLVDSLLNEKIHIESIDSSELYTDHLELNMKLYSKRKEAFPNQIKNQTHFLINGPVGIGLNLPEILEGNYVVFSAGTGIFPLLDFIGLSIRYMCSKVTKNKIYENENFTYIKPSFKVFVYSTFSDKESSVLHDLILKAHEIDKRNNLGILHFTERFSNKSKHIRWDHNFISEQLKLIGSDSIGKILLCGTPSFMNEVEKGVVNVDSELREKIIFA